MKKKLIIIVSIILLLLLAGLYCYKKDNIRFKIAYELYNKVELTNGKKIKVSIPIDNNVKYIKEKELIKLLKNGTGVIYMGYPTCPWCRNAIPILLESIKDNNIKTLYYVDTHSVKLGNVEKELIKEIGEYLKEDSDGNKVIAVPDVYVVKKGKIVGHHRSTVDSYKNPYKGMSDKQKKELKKIYDDMIKEIK